MGYPVLQYDATSGSDTAASGAGPATAVTGANAAHTGGAASTTITLTNTPNLASVATDGTAVLWLATTAGGRHLSKITGADNTVKTVTVEDSFTIASGSAVSYAIGGKRKTIRNDTSRIDTLDLKGGWTVRFASGTYSAPGGVVFPAGDQTNGWITAEPETGASVTLSGDTTLGVGMDAYVRIRGFTIGANYFNVPSRTGINVRSGISGQAPFDVVDCSMDSLGVGIDLSSDSGVTARFRNVQVTNCTSCGLQVSRGSSLDFGYCRFKSCVVGLELFSFTSAGRARLRGCLFEGNSTAAIRLGGTSGTNNDSHTLDVDNCDFYNNGDGVRINNTSGGPCIRVLNSIFEAQSGYGVNNSGGTAGVVADYNAFYNNTGGSYSANVTTGGHDVTLSASPAVSASTGDFTLHATNGAPCRGAGGPSTIGTTSTATHLNIGVDQGGSGGGGGGPSIPKIWTGAGRTQ